MPDPMRGAVRKVRIPQELTMNSNHQHYAIERRQKGNALFVALILLLLASVITLLTLRVGVFEQRTSGNDLRAKLIAQVAEAGIAQGAEYFRLNPGALTNTSNWKLCAADDETFPCGSIPDMDVDDGAGGTIKRRATMYYWSSAGATDNNNDGVTGDYFDQRMLPIHSVTPAAGRVTSVGNFTDVSYGVGVVLCRVANPKTAADPTRCATNSAEQSSTLVYNYVSVASLPGEGTRTTVSQMLGQYLIFNPENNKPPIVATGTVDVTGGLQLVTNPNAGGPGVPVSVWTRKDVVKTGTPNTCYYDEFIRYGGSTATWEGVETKVMVCDDCSCAGDKSLSYDSSGNLQTEGMDILDIDGNTPSTPKTGQVNYDVLPHEFPCDLFQFVFGTRARIDDDDGNGVHYLDENGNPVSGETGDYFCESRVPMVQYKTPGHLATKNGTWGAAAANIVVNLHIDEAYLYANADFIIPRDNAAAALMSDRQFLENYDLTYPSAALSGIVWCQKNCDIGAKTLLGTPDKPVLVVIDGTSEIKVQGRVFGLVFVRAMEDKLSAATGGSAALRMNAGAAIYGSVLVQGAITKANGSAAVIYNEDVFQNLAKSIPPKPSNLPGAWTDRLSY
jgi:hypothetical protein